MTSSSPSSISTVRGVTSFRDALTAAARRYVEASGFKFDHVEMRGLTATLDRVDYTPPQETWEQPQAIGDTELANDTTVSQQHEWSESYTNTLSTTVTVTRGLETGVDASFGLPEIGLGFGFKISASVSTEHTQAESSERTESWTQLVTVPPRSRVTGIALLSRVRYNVGFTATIRIDGDENSCPGVGVKGSHRRVFLASPGKWFAAAPTPGFIPDGSAVLFQVQGIVSGVEGRKVSARLQEYPLDGAAMGAGLESATAAAPQAARTYTVENVQALPRIVDADGAQ